MLLLRKHCSCNARGDTGSATPDLLFSGILAPLVSIAEQRQTVPGITAVTLKPLCTGVAVFAALMRARNGSLVVFVDSLAVLRQI